MMKMRSVFIVGWYGTETVGDKAILGSIFDHYRQRNPLVSFSVASFYPFVTRRSLDELDERAEVIPVYSAAFIRQAATADVVVIGGGPLMDLNELSIPLWAFKISRLFGKQRVVFGCGLGPLRKPRNLAVVRRILSLATDIRLRDSQSVIFANELIGRQDIELIQDPAIAYAAKRSQTLREQVPTVDSDVIACFLRDWPREYTGEMSIDEYHQTKDKFEANLARCLQTVCTENGLRLVLYPMHTFVVGGDDRVFYRQFIQKYFNNFRQVSYEYQPTNVDSILLAMLRARVCVCMRFHSVLFAHTLHKPYVAIDYSNHGKIYSFMQDVQAMNDYVSLLDLAAGSDTLLMSHLETHIQTSA
jgi:polysaccharide pyruvyl transferase WcaK-like protein